LHNHRTSYKKLSGGIEKCLLRFSIVGVKVKEGQTKADVLIQSSAHLLVFTGQLDLYT